MVRQRYADISKRCGLSEDIVKRVLKAETEYTIEELKHGEQVILAGRCIMKPELVSRSSFKADEGLVINKGIKVKIKPTTSLESKLSMCSEFEEEDSDISEEERIISENTRVIQIGALQ